MEPLVWYLFLIIFNASMDDGNVYRSETPLTYVECVDKLTTINAAYENRGQNYVVYCTKDPEFHSEDVIVKPLNSI